ncbi:magnesium transporter, partial [Pyramidobacter porci]
LRELVTALLLGGAMALLAAGRSLFIGAGGQVTFVVAMAMVCVVVASDLLGALMPFVVKRLGFDPALISGPLLATIVDVLGLALYFAVASAVLP